VNSSQINLAIHEATGIVADFTSCLNAMHEAEKVLNREQRNRYINLLDTMPDDSCPVQHDFQWCCSTAAQRAEAFLKTLNLWNP